MKHDRPDLGSNFWSPKLSVFMLAALLALSPEVSRADEGGVSFWLPGLFGSLAATPQQPGWSLANIYYHTSVSAGGDVAGAREFELGRVPGNGTVNANLNLHVNATGDLGIVIPSYVFATPVLGGQASVSVLGYSCVRRPPPGGDLVRRGHDAVQQHALRAVRHHQRHDMGFWGCEADLQLKWNAGVNNYMTYITGDIPVGAYQSTRLSNIGIGHGAIDAGGGYTYFNHRRHELPAVLAWLYLTISSTIRHNIKAASTCTIFDWGASQFVSKQVMLGLVGYVYKELGCDSGSGDHVGCFQSQVVGVGPQIGFLFPVGDMQGYLNLKAYRRVCRGEPTIRLEYLAHLLYLAAHARSASYDKAHRQKLLGSTKLRFVTC